MLVTEAGGVVKAIDGGEYVFDVAKSNLVCGNAEVVPGVVAAIKAADRKMWKKARINVCVCVLVFVYLCTYTRTHTQMTPQKP